MSAPELLPCPFCGGDPVVRTHRSTRTGLIHQSISCETSGCECAETAAYPIGEAEKRWNTRAILSDPRVKALVEALETASLMRLNQKDYAAVIAALAALAALKGGQDAKDQ